MPIARLIAGAAVAALLAGNAAAQTRSSTTTTTTTTGPNAAQTSGPAAQPYGNPAVTGAPAQPAASGSTYGAQATTGTPATSGTMGPGAATAGATSGFIPVQPVPGGNIIATLKASGEFTKLLAALDATNLTGLISTHPNLTLFAPTDTAFAALPPGQLDTLMKSPTQLQALLTYHLVATSIKEADVKGHSAGKVQAADNKELTIDGSGPSLKVNDATVLQPAVMASNGYIYPIDKVLTPPM